jgi:hypothetical protein
MYVYLYIRHPFIRVLENVNVLLFAFNRVVNVAHVHVHGVHHLFPHVCGPGAGRGRGAIITVFIIFFLC